MFSKIKQFLDPSKDEQRNGNEQEKNLFEREMERLETENQSLQERIVSAQNKLPRLHVECFYYQTHDSSHDSISEADLQQLPLMGMTVHFMESNKPVPIWIESMLFGLEETLSEMKVRYKKVSDPTLFSLFVDLKLYPHQEIKRTMALLANQFNHLHRAQAQAVTFRAHAGGDGLYRQLLEAHDSYAQSF